MARTLCHECGYDLAGIPPSTEGRRCPECGSRAKFPCFHCGHDLELIPEYGEVKVCPECGGLTPDVVHVRPTGTIRKWVIPLSIAAGVAVVACSLGLWLYSNDPYGVLGMVTALFLIPGASVLNGVVTLVLWLRASKKHQQGRGPRQISFMVSGAGVGAAIATMMAGEAALLLTSQRWH